VIKVGEYVEWRQPFVWRALGRKYPLRRPVPLVAVWVEGLPFELWRALMQERPRPGLAGLLPGEKAEVVNL